MGRPERLHYLIAPGDLLRVDILDVKELSGDYRVSADGAITLPLLSRPITGQGLTLDQLSAVIRDRLKRAGLVSHPHVLVTVMSSAVHAIAIMGAVQKPQVYPVFGPTTLLDVLAQGGGLAPNASNIAIITRGNMALRALALTDQGADARQLAQSTIKVDLNKLLRTGDPSENLTVYPGDKVTVVQAPIVYVVGAVNRAGGFPMTGDRRHMTVLKALALAESLKPTALSKRAFIIREKAGAPGGREQIPVNLQQILNGKAPDVKLAANDVLFVPDSTEKRALGPAIQIALQTISGMAIWGRF